MNKTNIVIYHNADFDGIASGIITRLALLERFTGDAIVMFGWDYGQPLPEYDWWQDYDTIYIVDLSVPALMDREDLREKIVWIDHHRSAIEKYARTVFRGFRIEGVAACRLCWSYFFYSQGVTLQHFTERQAPEPELITLLGEYDIWDHRDPRGKDLQFGLRTYSREEQENIIYSTALRFRSTGINLPLADLVARGSLVREYVQRADKGYATHASKVVKWEGLTFVVLNTSSRSSSTFDSVVAADIDACMSWNYDGSTNDVRVSLYHNAANPNSRPDLSVIATKYGGGGHAGACGFRASLSLMQEIL